MGVLSRLTFSVSIFWLTAGLCAAQQPVDGTTIIIVRHAEKADQSYDADLSEAGRDRSRRLAGLLKDAGVSALLATEFRRTQETLRPLSETLGVPISKFGADDTDAVFEEIRRKPGRVLVVASHSNVVPLLLERLGWKEPAAIQESEYDNLFIVTLQDNRPAGFLRLRY